SIQTTGELFTNGTEAEKIATAIKLILSSTEGQKENESGEIQTGVKTLHLIVCGVQAYQTDGFVELKYAVKDAAALKRIITEKFSYEFELIHTYELYDTDFSNENLNGILNRIAETLGENDYLLFFYAGHGAFIKNDTIYEYILKFSEKSGGLALSWLMESLDAINTQETTLILDACNSGIVVDYIIKNTIQKNIHYQTMKKKINIITSSKHWEKSAEIKELGHGLFTYCLLTVLESIEEFDIEKIVNELLLQMKNNSLKYLEEVQFPGIFLSD
ncbi:MAG: caspase family protein, partial [Candidatus Cloacimonetes bacterium]|nr:caspase family protein [Candidatus Cloacimonadota bacterium]